MTSSLGNRSSIKSSFDFDELKIAPSDIPDQNVDEVATAVSGDRFDELTEVEDKGSEEIKKSGKSSQVFMKPFYLVIFRLYLK